MPRSSFQSAVAWVWLLSPEDKGEGDTRSVEREAAQSPNTNSIDAVEVFLSSGASLSTAAGCFEPTSTAMYCLPLTE